jgi:hypothetical protein
LVPIGNNWFAIGLHLWINYAVSGTNDKEEKSRPVAPAPNPAERLAPTAAKSPT